MQRVRYQVFISSTSRDLPQERQAVLDAILRIGHFPAGMELFPASDATAWDVIRRDIDVSDYYVVVVGGRYGSTDSDGISYTEREYDYARNLGAHILAFLHEDPGALPADRQESKKSARKKLADFRRKLEKSHTCKLWREAHDLGAAVTASLTQEINLHPGVGWIRADEAPSRRDTARALRDLQSVLDEAAEQRGLREAVERRAQTVEAELEALRQQQAGTRAEAGHAGAREATAQAGSVHPHPDGIPASFDVTAAKDVLAGLPERVASFAIWSDTPQGHAFWREQKKRLESGQGLGADAREAIVQWLGARGANQ